MNQIKQDIWKWAKLVTPFLKCYVQLLAKSVHNLTRITVMEWRGLKRSGIRQEMGPKEAKRDRCKKYTLVQGILKCVIFWSKKCEVCYSLSSKSNVDPFVCFENSLGQSSRKGDR